MTSGQNNSQNNSQLTKTYSHRIMRDHTKKNYITIPLVQKSICIILSRAIIYGTFIFYLNNLGNLKCHKILRNELLQHYHQFTEY